ncbi:hypothetical protein LX15_002990 [Streptoalloteichus tenebrarius]|uniref:Uncharacterized protein n=1 Tax=Streptoalloteichus tenebrarius (strain ATCC 17920 / DSM 40477 / JCM 4838 / CBS 697.72 / NBRC 16177 / NCIMB 11028 / NRRL B-12390 / A12253. 1 / ISP 5477) TaxID=1933 RepID=A0ABT1HUU8_STRSD|nr:hypothetical protein [Streptoalloteichus tenebrarius]MCP2259289.1 hypothetical protein [Streptoalloteichus tenebrarius]BFE99050.1 hypothetical protein GCM10020241_07260 [Streptoalloteichus tenebrarius]
MSATWPEPLIRRVADDVLVAAEEEGEPLYFSDIASLACQLTGRDDGPEVWNLAVEATARLLRDGRLVAGSYARPHGWQPWDGTAADHVRRIRDAVAELAAAARPLYPGDVCAMVSKT